MVKYLVDKYYTGVTRYTASAFVRMKLSAAFGERDLTPEIYPSQEEARHRLKTKDGDL